MMELENAGYLFSPEINYPMYTRGCKDVLTRGAHYTLCNTCLLRTIREIHISAGQEVVVVGMRGQGTALAGLRESSPYWRVWKTGPYQSKKRTKKKKNIAYCSKTFLIDVKFNFNVHNVSTFSD